jgi:hypothetical protein
VYVSDNGSVSNVKLAMVWLLLLLVTWLPPVILALHKAMLADEDTGNVIVIFPVGSTTSENFERVVRAKGAFVGSALLNQVWIVYSYDPGFVRRLKDKGAWAVFDPMLLDPVALIGCGPLSKRQ